MPQLSPKAKLLKDPIFVGQHRKLVDSDNFEHAATVTLAELARLNVSADVMRGANLFLDTFQNLAEEGDKATKPFPHKHLIEPTAIKPPESK